MKNKILISIFSLLLICSCVFADDSIDSSTSWETLDKNYNTNASQKIRAVSDKEFDEAIDTVKKIRGYKKKEKEKDKKDQNNITPTGAPFIVDEPDYLLLRLPYNIGHGDIFIAKGFYKVSPVIKNNSIFLQFIQGPTSLAEVEMEKTDKVICPGQINCIETEVIDNKYFKLGFKDLDFTLIKYFQILP